MLDLSQNDIIDCMLKDLNLYRPSSPPTLPQRLDASRHLEETLTRYALNAFHIANPREDTKGIFQAFHHIAQRGDTVESIKNTQEACIYIIKAFWDAYKLNGQKRTNHYAATEIYLERHFVLQAPASLTYEL